MNPLIFSLGGDSRFFWQENIGDLSGFPSSWDAILNNGIGKPALDSLWITSYLNFTASFTKFGFSWEVINLVFWILPSIVLSFFSAFFLFNFLFPKKRLYALLAGFIYLFNTYFLMVFFGGQLGVALAYSLAPLVFLGFVRVIKECKLQTSIIAGLILGLQILFDPRLAFITLLAVGLYWLFFKKNIIFVFAVPAAIAVLLHSYWIIPLLLTRTPVIPAGFNSLAGFKFFSFTDFSHALSLLHPNWPENIFGKTYFLQPEFLILPIIAFSSLLFINSKVKTQNSIISLAFIGLLGAFLAKGASPPFGEVNRWLFQHFPPMVMFRDPTKFYLLTALSYSILIPFSVCSIHEWLKLKLNPSASLRQRSGQALRASAQNYLPNIFLLLITCYLLLLVRPLWNGELREEFKPREVPPEYVQLKDFLVSQPQFFRTLWLPDWQRFGYFSNTHPAIGKNGFLKELNKDETKQVLENFAVKYIIVPYDSEEEIFLNDRQYDVAQRQELVENLDKIPWLSKVSRFNELNHLSKIAVYEIRDYKDRFWTIGNTEVINWEMKKSTEYVASVKINEPSTLVFSESFDPNWQMTINDKKIQSEKMHNLFNGFALKEKGDYALTIEYTPQRYVYIGFIISMMTILASIGFLIFYK